MHKLGMASIANGDSVANIIIGGGIKAQCRHGRRAGGLEGDGVVATLTTTAFKIINLFGGMGGKTVRRQGGCDNWRLLRKKCSRGCDEAASTRQAP